MRDEILKCRDEVLASIVNDSNEVEAFRVKYL